MPNPLNNSGIRDNHHRGAVADFLKANIYSGSQLSVVSAYFTIYAYDALREHLDQIDHLDFLFGEPRFISSLDPSKPLFKSKTATESMVGRQVRTDPAQSSGLEARKSPAVGEVFFLDFPFYRTYQDVARKPFGFKRLPSYPHRLGFAPANCATAASVVWAAFRPRPGQLVQISTPMT